MGYRYSNSPSNRILPKLDQTNITPLDLDSDIEKLEAGDRAEIQKLDLTASGSSLPDRTLSRIPNSLTYLIVRLPQQYVGEQSYCLDSESGTSGYPQGETAAAFVSGG